VEDRELKAFLQKHDLDPAAGGVHVGLGMPFREITGALKSLTGHRVNEDELNFVTLMGGPEQRLAQRRIFQRLAERWAVWWLKNRRKFTDDPAYFLVNLPQLPDLGPAGPADRQFPTGDAVKVTGNWANVILGPPQPQPYYRTFGDLDSGLGSKWSEELPPPEKATASDVSTYAKREGYDLRGIEYRPRDGSPPFYALECLELKAWQIENHRFGTVVEELKKGQQPELNRPAGELLVDRDPATGVYRPENEATFLFITREGATGVLQVTSQITDLFRPEDFGQPVAGKTNRGFYRGVQYQFHLFYQGDTQEPKPADPGR